VSYDLGGWDREGNEVVRVCVASDFGKSLSLPLGEHGHRESSKQALRDSIFVSRRADVFGGGEIFGNGKRAKICGGKQDAPGTRALEAAYNLPPSFGIMVSPLRGGGVELFVFTKRVKLN